MTKDKSFRYDAEKEIWTECLMPEWQTADASLLPVAIVCNLRDERTGERGKRAWCESHHAYEEIDHAVEGGLATTQGCLIRGMAVYTDTWIGAMGYGATPDDAKECILRWRVCRVPESGHVMIAKDTAHIMFKWQQIPAAGRFVYTPFVCSFSHAEAALSLEDDNPPQYLCPMPASVVSAALEMLSEDASIRYGIAPSVDFPTETNRPTRSYRRQKEDDSSRLLAFLHRPLDMRIWSYRDLFEGYDFDARFPRTQADNFPILCDALGLAPTKNLRRAYESGRTAFMLQCHLPELGISQETLLEEFTGCTEFLGSIHPKKPQETPNEMWEHLRFYCNWRRENESEAALAKHLLDMNDSWHAWKGTALALFHQLFPHISPVAKEEILRNGLTAHVHDELAMIAHEQAMHSPDRVYDEATKALECKTGGYNFRLIDSSAIFRNICTYGNKDWSKDNSVLIVIERNGAYLGMITVRDSMVQQFRVVSHLWNSIGSAGIHLAYLRWLNYTGLYERFPMVRASLHGRTQELPVEPIDLDEAWERMSLRELLTVPEASIRPGYYLHFFRRLSEARLLRPAPPGAADDEFSYLSAHFPAGKRIYDAAWAGNPEAQHVMGLLYSEECHCFAWSDLRLAALWNQRARENHWEDIAPTKPLSRLEFLCPAVENSGYSRESSGCLIL